jgi:hypothetical protein
MKKPIIVLLCATFLTGQVSSSLAFAQTHQASTKNAQYSEKQNKNLKHVRGKKRNRPMPVTPGSTVIWLKPDMHAEIRPDGSVWWFGSNYRKALVGDGEHEMKDGKKIVTQSGKLVSPKSLLPKQQPVAAGAKKPAA